MAVVPNDPAYSLNGKTLAVEYPDGRRQFFDVRDVDEVESGKFKISVTPARPSEVAPECLLYDEWHQTYVDVGSQCCLRCQTHHRHPETCVQDDPA